MEYCAGAAQAELREHHVRRRMALPHGKTGPLTRFRETAGRQCCRPGGGVTDQNITSSRWSPDRPVLAFCGRIVARSSQRPGAATEPVDKFGAWNQRSVR